MPFIWTWLFRIPHYFELKTISWGLAHQLFTLCSIRYFDSAILNCFSFSPRVPHTRVQLNFIGLLPAEVLINSDLILNLFHFSDFTISSTLTIFHRGFIAWLSIMVHARIWPWTSLLQTSQENHQSKSCLKDHFKTCSTGIQGIQD